ncbi:EMAL2 protein, partial [Polypterus senegalus]
MTRPTFEMLCGFISPDVAPITGCHRPPVPTQKRIAIALYKMATCAVYRVKKTQTKDSIKSPEDAPGPVSKDKNGFVTIAIHAKPGSKQNAVTGRDSVQRSKTSKWQQFNFQHADDQELITKIEKIFLNHDLDFEIEELRKKIKERERGQNLISKKELTKICLEIGVPLHGSSLNQLLSRCDDENNGMVNWPEFLQFLAAALEGAQETLKSSVQPDLRADASSLLQIWDKTADYSGVESVESELDGSVLTYCVPEKFQCPGPWLKTPPHCRLELEWVYGIGGPDCGSNLLCSKSGKLVYFISCIGVVFNVTEKTQKHYCEHTAKITSLALHPDGDTAATGQAEQKNNILGKAHVRVWHLESLQTLHVIGMHTFMSSVTSIGFSYSQALLVAIDSRRVQLMAVWDLSMACMVAKCKIGTAEQSTQVTNVRFGMKNAGSLLTAGEEHLVWWTIDRETGRIVESQKADYQKESQPKCITCVLYSEKGDLITGDSNGNVYVWPSGSNTISHFIRQAHEGPILSLCLHQNMLLTTARDDNVLVWHWGKTFECFRLLKIPVSEGGVYQIAVAEDALYMATVNGSILQADISSLNSHSAPIVLCDKAITVGHSDSVLALAVDAKPHPDCRLFVSAGFDGALHVYNAQSKECLARHCFRKSVICCVSASLAERLIAVISKERDLTVFHVSVQDTPISLQKAATFRKIAPSPPLCMQFSPCGKKLALACADMSIYVFLLTRCNNTEVHVDAFQSLKGHTSRITGLDWTADEGNHGFHILRSSSTDGEHKIWNTDTGEEVENAMLWKDANWASETSTTGFTKKGLLHSLPRHEVAVGVDVSSSSSCLVVATLSGKLFLFRHPLLHSNGEFDTYCCGTNAAAVRFLHGGSHLIVIGGKDCAITQWKMATKDCDLEYSCNYANIR